MKQYKILAVSVTGFRNKHLKEGNVYPASDFIQKNIPDLEAMKAIKEYTVVTKVLTEKDLKDNPALAEQGKKAGDTITEEQ